MEGSDKGLIFFRLKSQECFCEERDRERERIHVFCFGTPGAICVSPALNTHTPACCPVIHREENTYIIVASHSADFELISNVIERNLKPLLTLLHPPKKRSLVTDHSADLGPISSVMEENLKSLLPSLPFLLSPKKKKERELWSPRACKHYEVRLTVKQHVFNSCRASGLVSPICSCEYCVYRDLTESPPRSWQAWEASALAFWLVG